MSSKPDLGLLLTSVFVVFVIEIEPVLPRPSSSSLGGPTGSTYLCTSVSWSRVQIPVTSCFMSSNHISLALPPVGCRLCCRLKYFMHHCHVSTCSTICTYSQSLSAMDDMESSSCRFCKFLLMNFNCRLKLMILL